MQLSIVLSRIEAEETNGSEGRLQTGGGGGGGGGERGDDEMTKVREESMCERKIEQKGAKRLSRSKGEREL